MTAVSLPADIFLLLHYAAVLHIKNEQDFLVQYKVYLSARGDLLFFLLFHCATTPAHCGNSKVTETMQCRFAVARSYNTGHLRRHLIFFSQGKTISTLALAPADLIMLNQVVSHGRSSAVLLDHVKGGERQRVVSPMALLPPKVFNDAYYRPR